jgi:hypothetical protein
MRRARTVVLAALAVAVILVEWMKGPIAVSKTVGIRSSMESDGNLQSIQRLNSKLSTFDY